MIVNVNFSFEQENEIHNQNTNLSNILTTKWTPQTYTIWGFRFTSIMMTLETSNTSARLYTFLLTACSC